MLAEDLMDQYSALQMDLVFPNYALRARQQIMERELDIVTQQLHTQQEQNALLLKIIDQLQFKLESVSKSAEGKTSKGK